MPIETLIIYILLGILVISNIILAFYFIKLKKQLNKFFNKGKKNLGEVLSNQIQDIEKHEENIQKSSKNITELAKISKKTFQKISVKRYNPFKEVGGDQSFSIALLNSQNDGVIITSHYGRDFNRIYAKPVKKGKSGHSLSKEEKETIDEAIIS